MKNCAVEGLVAGLKEGGGGACFSFQVMGNGSTPYAKRELVGDGGINVAATTTKGEAAEIFGFLGWLFLCTSAWSG